MLLKLCVSLGPRERQKAAAAKVEARLESIAVEKDPKAVPPRMGSTLVAGDQIWIDFGGCPSPSGGPRGYPKSWLAG